MGTHWVDATVRYAETSEIEGEIEVDHTGLPVLYGGLICVRTYQAGYPNRNRYTWIPAAQVQAIVEKVPR